MNNAKRYKVRAYHGTHITLYDVVDTRDGETRVTCATMRDAEQVAEFHNTGPDYEQWNAGFALKAGKP